MTPHRAGDVPEVLQAITLRIDDTRDLLEVAAQHLTILEGRVRGHDYAINDLHWDAARILTSGDDPYIATPTGRTTVRAVQDGSQELALEIRRSAATAGTAHGQLTQASRELTHVDRLLGALRLPEGESLAEVAVEDATLTGRTERLSMLVEIAIPLAERAQRQLTEAQEVLDRQVSGSAQPDVDRWQQFWDMDVGVFDGSRAVAQARTTARDGAEVTGRPVAAGGVTAVHVRRLLNLHPQHPQHRHQPPTAARPLHPDPASDPRITSTRKSPPTHVPHPPHPPHPDLVTGPHDLERPPTGRSDQAITLEPTAPPRPAAAHVYGQQH